MQMPAVFPDRFAVEWGDDEHGIFQSFAVGHIVQRMRWIAPGKFLMGSPKHEVGRSDDETQHLVELTHGYWLADTPVTQALWEAVMRTNPSRFKGTHHPVDTVSWDDAQEFLVRLNEMIPGLDARLPTEAEWEHACRAGTTTATWVGDLENEIADPRLNPIAWYQANARDTTHSVAQKQANPWGLYDMLGNVWEWCADRYAAYDAAHVRDPASPDMGANRVLRGGGWLETARLVRAAHRRARRSDFRRDYVGFRLARGSGPG